MITQSYGPNSKTIQFSQNDTNMNVWATDGVGYTTYAALVAAGKTPWPNLDPGSYVNNIDVRTLTGADADGSFCYFKTNPSTTPTKATAKSVSGSGQNFIAPGLIINQFWAQKVTGSDLLEVTIWW